MPREHSAHDMQLTTFQTQHATGTFDIRHDNIHMRGAGAPLFFSARERPALSPRSTFKPLGGVKVERFSGPAVLRRCCPLSSERVACCQSPRESRGAASVLPFFRGRAEEVARWQCLRNWAQGGWPCHLIFHGGPLRFVGDAAGGSAMCRGGTGASARTTTTYYQLLPTSLLLLLHTTFYLQKETYKKKKKKKKPEEKDEEE